LALEVGAGYFYNVGTVAAGGRVSGMATGSRETEAVRMARYQCQVCGHIYDPARGEPRQDVPPGTDFEELPEDWVCPVCASPKHMYEPM
jgi:rubredoxin